MHLSSSFVWLSQDSFSKMFQVHIELKYTSYFFRLMPHIFAHASLIWLSLTEKYSAMSTSVCWSFQCSFCVGFVGPHYFDDSVFPHYFFLCDIFVTWFQRLVRWKNRSVLWSFLLFKVSSVGLLVWYSIITCFDFIIFYFDFFRCKFISFLCLLMFFYKLKDHIKYCRTKWSTSLV